MSAAPMLDFAHVNMSAALGAMCPSEVDALQFGVIGIDADYIVRLYNAFESRLAGLTPDGVIGQPLFTVVAPCMNNFMVAQRYEDAAQSGTTLDATIDYVLTLRMRPSKVKLRLLSTPGNPLQYLLVNRIP